jgi:Arc/MetJ-type ribon-helix-helix transcriptional regulator
MKKNIVLGTSVPFQVAQDVESLVDLGRYRSKSDFLYQAIVEKLKKEEEYVISAIET